MGRIFSLSRGQSRPCQNLEPNQIPLGLPYSTAYSKLLTNNDRTFLMNTEKCNAFDIPPTLLNALGPMAKVELLSIFSERFSKAIHAMRSKGTAGAGNVPPIFLKALGPMA